MFTKFQLRVILVMCIIAVFLILTGCGGGSNQENLETHNSLGEPRTITPQIPCDRACAV